MTRADPYWLDGVRVVVTSGGTREPIDPVRYLGNRSSGKMGNALAVAAARAGGAVTLITAQQPEPELEGIAVEAVDTAAQMLDAVVRHIAHARLLIMAAAVADYRPAAVAKQKIKKGPERITLELERTVDILTALRELPERSRCFVVGFAAETDDPVPNATAKLEAKGLDMIVVNDISRHDIGMGADDNEVTVIDASGIVDRIPRAPKHAVADAILRDIRSRMT